MMRRLLPFWRSSASGGTRRTGDGSLLGLLQPLQGLPDETARLGRELFRATTLLEGQAATLDEVAEGLRQHLAQHERREADLGRTLAELDGRVQLALVKDLLPIADALDASVRAARALIGGLGRGGPARSPQPGWLARLLGTAPPRAPAAVDQRPALEAWLDGLLLVQQRLRALLERWDVEPIPALGEAFDPHRHLAVAVRDDPGAADGTVVDEERRGYTCGGRVLRHAEVVVARHPTPDT